MVIQKFVQNLDVIYKIGYSNSRLSGNFFTTPEPKLNFDDMKIVGNLNIGLLFF